MLYTDGTIETPDFPAHYPASTKCRWIITADTDKKIALNFESFQTEPGRDYLNVTPTNLCIFEAFLEAVDISAGD